MASRARSSPAPRAPGRPREFDIERAIDRAIDVFRQRGFHATSIGDLQHAMAITAGSIYKAFKDKRAVFVAALDRYMASRDAAVDRRLAACRTGRERLSGLLTWYVEMSSGREGRLGCLVVGTAVEVAVLDREIAERIRTRLNRVESRIAEIIEAGKRDRSIRPTVDSAATARVMLCILQGLRVVGKLGRSDDDMRAVIEAALKLVD